MTTTGFLVITLLFTCGAAAWYYASSQRRRYGAPFPPGPKSSYLLRNGRKLRGADGVAWKYFAALRKKYGDLVHFDAFGRHIVVINSYSVAKEMLEKQAVVYSGRPSMPMLRKLMGFDKSIGFGEYGPDWRERRKIVHQMVHKTAMTKFWSHLTAGMHQFLRRSLDDPDNFKAHLRLSIGSVILRSTYGIEISSPNDEYLRVAEASLRTIGNGAFGNYIVDLFPALEIVPEWFPFFKFKKDAKKWRSLREEMVNKPFEFAKSHEGQDADHVDSFVANLLSGNFKEDNIKYACGSLFGAGVDTTLITIKTVVYALMIHPEIQARAQAEIDSVVGPINEVQRLPTFEDRQSFPFINALIKEALRWHLAAPLGVNHSAIQDDVFHGYFIPKNTVIHPNQWAMSRDEDYYDDPEEFRPERFLGENPALDPYLYVFGFGRRSCVGIHFADAVVFIATAFIVGAFNVSTPVDERGNRVVPQITHGHAGFSLEFQCHMEPRSSQIATLIRNSELDVASH